MAEYRYVSLKDVLKDESIPKLNLREPNVESEDEPDFDLVSKSLRNPTFSSSPLPFSLRGSCSNIYHDEGKMKKAGEKKKKKSKGLHARFSSLKHSRSDEPLVYVKCDEDDIGDAFDDLMSLCQEMKNFSWEERTLKKSNILFESEEE